MHSLTIAAFSLAKSRRSPSPHPAEVGAVRCPGAADGGPCRDMMSGPSFVLTQTEGQLQKPNSVAQT